VEFVTSRLRAALAATASVAFATTAVLLAPAVAPAATLDLGTRAATTPGLVVDPDTLAPPGANDFACRPSSLRPYPVVLVPGTFESMAKNWSTLSPVLADAGYCVFALNYGETNGVYATGPIEISAQELSLFVNKVLKSTKARKVAIVGHSQGGMMPRQYLRFEGGTSKVRSLVGIAPSNHGTEGLITPAPDGTGAPSGNDACVACDQQQAGSPFLQRLNKGGDLVGGTTGPFYTVISTQYDEVVTPYQSQFLVGPASRVTNILIQDVCPTDLIEHDQAPNDPVVHQLVLEALSHNSGPADPAPRVDCTPIAP